MTARGGARPGPQRRGCGIKNGGGMILVGFRGTVTYKRFGPPHEEWLLAEFRQWLAKHVW